MGSTVREQVTTRNSAPPLNTRTEPTSPCTMGNWLTSGGDLWSLKFTNLMIHLLCGTLLFWLAGRLFAEPLAGVAPQR